MAGYEDDLIDDTMIEEPTSTSTTDEQDESIFYPIQ